MNQGRFFVVMRYEQGTRPATAECRMQNADGGMMRDGCNTGRMVREARAECRCTKMRSVDLSGSDGMTSPI